MALNNSDSTRRVKEAADYFNSILDKWSRHSPKEIEFNDQEFGSMIKESAYAAAVFINPVYAGYFALRIKGQNMESDTIPKLSSVRHVTTMLGSYVDGNRKFTKVDIKELGKMCDSLAACVDALEKSNTAK